MTSVDVYIYIVIGLLGVAYPVLLQVVARLDEKYSSDKIVELFNQEWANKTFRYFLISSLFFIMIWSFKLPTIIHIDGFDFFIENSASLFLAINSILLVISFFFFVKKILIYYTPTKIIQYLIAKSEKSEDDFQYFTALSELLFLFIKKQQTNYSKTLSDFFYTAFRKIREKQLNQPIVYPDLYYEVVYKAIEELAILKEKRNYLLENRTSGEIWLLGELQGNAISEKTYLWMWRNLILAIRYQQDDLIINHWKTCHQYYYYHLPCIYKNYDNTIRNIKVSNQEDVDKRLLERKKFIEFHYVLGGLLTYKERYSCIKRIFSHTQSQPPRYELLPESMYEIFSFYFDVKDPYERHYPWISNSYYFPDLSGLNADYVIKKWIMSYMAILFLRQYTIISYTTNIHPLDFPNIPKTQGEIKQWIDGLDFFKELVNEHLKNRELLKTLSLDFITSEWARENDKPFPITFIETFKLSLESSYNVNALNLPVSNSKVRQFEYSTKTIIESTIAKINKINNEESIQDDNSDKWYVNGQKMLQSKDAFSDNPEVHYSEFDSFLASSVSKDLEYVLSETLFYKKIKSFLLKPEDFFKAINRLAIDDSYVIINFGINIEFFINHFKVPELSTEKYRNINIYSFNGSLLVKDSLFILKKCDLPNITTEPVDNKTITKYSLNKISDVINLHSSVIDLNSTSEDVYIENKQDKSDDELKKSVLLNIIISTEFKWKKNIVVIQLKQYSDYLQKGLVNKLDDVNSINEEKLSS